MLPAALILISWGGVIIITVIADKIRNIRRPIVSAKIDNDTFEGYEK